MKTGVDLLFENMTQLIGSNDEEPSHRTRLEMSLFANISDGRITQMKITKGPKTQPRTGLSTHPSSASACVNVTDVIFLSCMSGSIIEPQRAVVMAPL